MWFTLYVCGTVPIYVLGDLAGKKKFLSLCNFHSIGENIDLKKKKLKFITFHIVVSARKGG